MIESHRKNDRLKDRVLIEIFTNEIWYVKANRLAFQSTIKEQKSKERIINDNWLNNPFNNVIFNQ